MVKVSLAALAAALILVGGEAAGSPTAKQDVSIPMDDGVSIAATHRAIWCIGFALLTSHPPVKSGGHRRDSPGSTTALP